MALLSAAQTEPIATSESIVASKKSSSLSTSESSNLFEVDIEPRFLAGSLPGSGPALDMVIRQDPFSMTLDANALLAGALFLLIGMHFVPHPFLESLVLAVPILLLVRNDYQNFLLLGPGGTPPTLAGYCRLAWLRLFILRDPFSPPPISPSITLRPAHGILAAQKLPYRPGPTPTVAGLAPQRQLNETGSVASFTALRTTLSRLAADQPARFGTATSCLEKHGFALFARHPVNVCGNGEICHIHNSDWSMHMNLHPEDIAEVLTKGWAQRHPLAWGREPSQDLKAKWWFPFRVRSPLPETFVLVYSPRDESDLRVVCKIIEAAIWYTVEERVDLEALLMVQPS